jgi:SOS-response transcriptional repressor LexA
MWIQQCPHCHKPIAIQAALQAVQDFEDEAAKLLTQWLGLAHWGSLQLEFIRERIVKHGMPGVRYAVEQAVRANAKSWQYLDKVLENQQERQREESDDGETLESLVTGFEAMNRRVPAPNAATHHPDGRPKSGTWQEAESLF